MKQFSIAHLAALATLVLFGSLAVTAPRRYPGRWVKWASWALAAVIFAGWVGDYVAELVVGTWTLQYSLPLQLTDAVALAAIIALLTRRRLFVELVYFWAFSASLQAALTPDLGSTFPSVLYFTYFLYHVGSIIAACLLVFGLPAVSPPRRDLARLPADACVHSGIGPGRRDHRRQLHVPAQQADPQLAAQRDGPMAAVHRHGRGARADHVRRAQRDRKRSRTTRGHSRGSAQRAPSWVGVGAPFVIVIAGTVLIA